MFREFLALFGWSKTEKVTQSGPQQITVCCDAPIDLVRVGDVLYARCTECSKYIGHIVSSGIGLLESRYAQYIGRACADRQIEHLPTAKELATMYPGYCAYLDKFAQQAARSILKDYMPIERT